MAPRTKAKGLARPAAAPVLGAVVEELPAAPAPDEPDGPEVLAALEAPEEPVDDAADEPVDDAADEPEAAPAAAPLVESVAILMVVFLLIATPVPALAAAPVMELFAAAMADEMVPLREVRMELSDAGTMTGARPIAPEVLAGMLVVDADDDIMEDEAPPVRANCPE